MILSFGKLCFKSILIESLKSTTILESLSLFPPSDTAVELEVEIATWHFGLLMPGSQQAKKVVTV